MNFDELHLFINTKKKSVKSEKVGIQYKTYQNKFSLKHIEVSYMPKIINELQKELYFSIVHITIIHLLNC